MIIKEILRILALAAITLVEVEFGLHVIYHAATGKAGIYDPPFDYLKELWRALRCRSSGK